MSRRGRGKRRLAACGVTLVAGMLLGSSSTRVGARPDVQLAQAEPASAPGASSSATIGDVVGENPTVSGDGRYVVFQGVPLLADELAARNGENLESDPESVVDVRTSTIYLTDRLTGETTEITPVPDGLSRTGNSIYPVISGDGCVVVTLTELALDVFRDDDTGTRWDVYRSALPHCGGAIGDWELISTRPDTGGLARDDVVLEPPTVNRPATLVAYTHPADHLYEADGVNTVSLVDLAVPVGDDARSRFVAGMPVDSPNTVFTHGGIDQPALSDDGSHLVYRSDATSADAVPRWGSGQVEGGPATPQVFLWDLNEPDPFLAVQLVSAAPDGSPSLAGAGDPDVSRSGGEVVFSSPDLGLVDAEYPNCAAECPSQVYLLDRDTDGDGRVGPTDLPALRIVSAVEATSPPVAGTAPSNQPVISADGELVAFVSKATNLQLIQAPGHGGGDDGEIFVSALHSGALIRATTGPDGVVPTQGVHAHPDLDDTGRTTVFDTSAAGDLIGETAMAGRQVVWTSTPPQLELADVNVGTTLVGLESDEWYISVINDGPATFLPGDVSMEASDFTIVEDSEYNTCFLGAAVPAGDNCTVAIRFTPRRSGQSSAVVTVSEVGFGAVSASATVSGLGGEPAITAKPGGLDFPDAEVGDVGVELQVDIVNASIIPTRLNSFEVTGAHPSDFVIYSNHCRDRPLNPRAACSVGVVFIPTDAGRRTALLEVATTSGQVATAILAGDAQFAPEVEIDVSTVEAGREFVATGRRYPANTEVTVVFGDGPSDVVTAVTDEGGAFTVPVPVSTTERGGARTVVVQTSSGAAASAPVEVIESTQQWIGIPGFGLG